MALISLCNPHVPQQGLATAMMWHGMHRARDLCYGVDFKPFARDVPHIKRSHFAHGGLYHALQKGSEGPFLAMMGGGEGRRFAALLGGSFYRVATRWCH